MAEQDDAGLWVERLGTRSFDGRPALFLDRDGVILEEVHFISHAGDVRLTKDVAPALARVNAAGIAVVVVTNQSGVARGHFGWSEFQLVQAKMLEELAAVGASVDLVLACGYHIEGRGDLARDHPWRKPNAGMLLAARNRLGINLSRSHIVGDRVSDLAAGMTAGLPGGALVRTGYGAEEAVTGADQLQSWSAAGFGTTFSPTAADAIVAWLNRADPVAY